MYTGTYDRLNVMTWDSDMQVIRRARMKLVPELRRSSDPAVRATRKRFYRDMLAIHHDWQKVCVKWRM